MADMVYYLGYFVAAFVFSEDRHCGLGRWAVEPFCPPLYRTFWSPTLSDQECQEHQEFLSIILEELLRCI